nr:DUF6266 family protein [Pedobacter sp. ASV19]
MARYKNGINGPVSGKVGMVIGSSCRGIQYLKSVADVSAVPATEAQLNQRLKLALVSGWLRPLLSWINVGYQMFRVEKTPMNAAVSYHMKETLLGEGPDYRIDFAKAIFSRGDLLISWVKKAVLLMNGTVHVVWENGPLSVFCKENDRANFILYNAARGKFVTFREVALRAAKEVLLDLPPGFASDILHGWLHFVNEAGDQVSTSVYIGELRL